MPEEREKGRYVIYYLDEWEDAIEQGYTESDAPDAYRGIFFSLEDALEYASTIPVPTTIVQTSDGWEVYVDYVEVGEG